jgi:hypothetical protein
MNGRLSLFLNFANRFAIACAVGIPAFGYCAQSETIIHDGARVKVIADDANGRLLIRIDGENAAFIDANGLNVRGSSQKTENKAR